MNDLLTAPCAAPSTSSAFTAEQKEYLAGLLAAQALRASGPGAATATPPAEELVFGQPLSEVAKQEVWKHAENPLDSWDRLLEHAQQDKPPNDEDNYRFRTLGLFHVAPTQDSFMVRCRIPAGELTGAQLRGLAELSDSFGNGKAALTTRSNLQIREIKPRDTVNVLMKLQSLGLVAKGSGADNIRNITASPTAGIDRQELLDTRPFAHGLHHYILNHRDLYGLPRKFNVAFEGGGAVDTVADTNDIGFMAVRVRDENATAAVAPGVYFRVELAGISGHKQLAVDAGIVVVPNQAVAVAVAMIRVFLEHGDRTDRKKARLKYLIDKWGIPKFLEATRQKLAFPLPSFPLSECTPRAPALKHGHIGVYRQKQPGRNYVGVVIPVGLLTTRQMRRLADLAEHFGSGQVRLTPWQNLLIPDIPDAFVETVKRSLVRVGFHYEASHIAGGLVACTGNTGCKYAGADTKGHALALARYLEKRVHLDQPLNIHLTGCPNSCAQHYVGDIGLQGVTVNQQGTPVEGYHVVFGGGTGAHAGIGKEVFKALSFDEIPALLEHVLQVFQARRQPGETFADFTRRHDVKTLQELFTP
jgi:ferredoxin-nitrite reductase